MVRKDRVQGVLQVTFKFTFPNDDDGPALRLKCLSFVLVAAYISGEFGLPKFTIGLWQMRRAFGASVPEAAVDEDREFLADEGDVRADGWRTTPSAWRRHPSLVRRGVKNDPAVEAVAAKAGVPEGFAEREFRSGVLGAVGAHDARDGLALWRGRAFVTDVVDT